MAKLRKANSYRRIERPYTRISKYRKLAYVRTRPHMVIIKFDTGNTAKQLETFKYNIELNSTKNLQIRHNAFEAARVASTRALEKTIGKSGFHLKIKTFPHHILRENALASGAGADRVSQGMSRAFGKLVGTAAQIRIGQTIIVVGVDTLAHTLVAKDALHKAACKFPCSCKIVIKEVPVAVVKKAKGPSRTAPTPVAQQSA